MSKGAYDVFALVINFINSDLQPKHVTIGLFEAIETLKQTLAKSLTKLLDKYGLRKKIIAYVKDEGSNLNAMTCALKFVVNYESLGLKRAFKVLVLDMHFQKHVNMALQRKKIVEI
jgi:hypothetical protein